MKVMESLIAALGTMQGEMIFIVQPRKGRKLQVVWKIYWCAIISLFSCLERLETTLSILDPQNSQASKIKFWGTGNLHYTGTYEWCCTYTGYYKNQQTLELAPPFPFFADPTKVICIILSHLFFFCEQT